MVIADDYPFLEIVGTMIVFFAFVIWIWMVCAILADVFRRRDIGGWHKVAWVVFLIVVPFIGVLSYLIAQHEGMSDRTAEKLYEHQDLLVAQARGAGIVDARATGVIDGGAPVPD